MASFWDYLPARGSGRPYLEKAAAELWRFIPPELRGKVQATGDVAQVLTPGSGTVQASLDAPHVAQDFRDGNYGDAALGTAMGILGTAADWVPPAKFAMAAATRSGKGVLGRGPREPSGPDLPMDQASRMSRAYKLGYQIDMPIYHGTSQEFRAFDMSKAGSSTGTPTSRVAIWGATEPKDVEEFAKIAQANLGGLEQIMPLFYRTERRGTIHLKGQERRHEVAATLAQAWDDGFDAVVVKNFAGAKGDLVAIKDPAQLRSHFAVFDPAKKESKDLLAGFAGSAVIGSAAMRDDADDVVRPTAEAPGLAGPRM